MKKVLLHGRYTTENWKKQGVLTGKRGSGATDAILTIFVIILIILPVFATVVEKYIMFIYLQEASDILDMSCITAYQAIRFEEASRGSIYIDPQRLEAVFSDYIECNSKVPFVDITVKELDIITGSYPKFCRDGVKIDKTSVHAKAEILIETGFFKKAYMGVGINRRLLIHRDVELPIK